MEAAALAQSLRSWLVTEGIVASELTDCGLGPNGGHPPGPNYYEAVVSCDGYLPQLVTNGVELEVGRVVAIDMQGATQWQCGGCGHWHGDQGVLMTAIGQWYEGNDHSALVCSACSISNPLTGISTKPPAACAPLALTFWNWPPLADAFLTQVAERVGQTIKVVSGKL